MHFTAVEGGLLISKRIKPLCCYGIVPRNQLFKKSAWLFHQIGDKAPPVPPVRTLNQCCYPHTGHGGHSWRLSISLSLSVGFSIQVEVMDVARSASQGTSVISIQSPLGNPYNAFCVLLNISLFSLHWTPQRFTTAVLITSSLSERGLKNQC